MLNEYHDVRRVCIRSRIPCRLMVGKRQLVHCLNRRCPSIEAPASNIRVAASNIRAGDLNIPDRAENW